MTQNDPARDDARARVAETLRRYHLDRTASPKDVDAIVALRTQILTPGRAFPDVLADFQTLYTLLARLQGSDAVAPATVTQGTIFPTFLTVTRLKAAGPPPSDARARTGQLAHVEKVGTGPVPMILVPDYGSDWTMYRAFIERNRDRYTMYAVTLPGFGGTPVPPRPKTFDPAKTPWWDSAEKAVVELIARERLDRPVILGTQTGAYLAARVALDHPAKTRGVVLLNAFVNVPLQTPPEAVSSVSLDERRRTVARRPDLNGIIAEFIPELTLSPEAALASLDAMQPQTRAAVLGRNTRDPERAKAIYVDFLARTDPRALEYFFELSGTDLMVDLARLRVPMLSAPSTPDAGAPPGTVSPLPQWREIKRRYPSIPLTIAPIENIRAYAVEDAPDTLDRAVAAFVAGRSVVE
jgi:pimeloyl-ACP methyl ester carboxylesterase